VDQPDRWRSSSFPAGYELSDEFRGKRDDVLRVYYETPKKEHIACVDEKTGLQALETPLR
jgi:hypothetical protein